MAAAQADVAELVRRLQLLETALEERVAGINQQIAEQQAAIEALVRDAAARGEGDVQRFEQIRQAVEAQGRSVEQLQRAMQQLENAQARAAAPGGGGARGGLVDTRVLGKPETFAGDPAKWRDFKLVFLAYAGAVNPRLEELMQQQVGRDTVVLLASLAAEDRVLAIQLSYMLTLQLKGTALDQVRNAPEQSCGLES